jgi:Uma2 family endonuclease
MATKTLLTIEQYAALDGPAGLRYELSRGELIVTPSPSYLHNRMRDQFNARLRAFLDAHPHGEVTSGTDMTLDADTVRRSDIAYIRKERLEGTDVERVPLPIAPDLAIEIVSKNDCANDLNLKASQYLQAGVQAVWLFFVPAPNSPTAMFRANSVPRFAAPRRVTGSKSRNCSADFPCLFLKS